MRRIPQRGLEKGSTVEGKDYKTLVHIEPLSNLEGSVKTHIVPNNNIDGMLIRLPQQSISHVIEELVSVVGPQVGMMVDNPMIADGST